MFEAGIEVEPSNEVPGKFTVAYSVIYEVEAVMVTVATTTLK
jgi:hypothetical protein